jgi:hypothetical protein
MDRRLKAALRGVAVAGGVFALAGFAFWGVKTGFSVAVGAFIAVANLYVLARIVAGLLPNSQGGSTKGWAAFAMLKLLALFAIVFFLIDRGFVQAIPLMFGFGALPIGIAIASMMSDRTRDDNSAG